MQLDFFWNTWQTPYKQIYRALLVLFGLSILTYTLAILMGSDMVITWQEQTIIEPVRHLLHTYHLGIFQFPVRTDNYIIFQQFSASGIRLMQWPGYLLLIWLGIFVSLYCTLITKLDRFWFVAGVALFTLMLVGLKLDFLTLFHSFGKLGLLVALALYYIPLYVFHFHLKDASLLRKWAVFGLATLVFALVVYFFSGVELPMEHLITYGVYVPTALTVIFVLLVGHDIISGLLRLISSGMVAGSKNSITHFLVFSAIFLLNTALALLRSTGKLDTGIYTIGSFGLLTLAALLGVWGFRDREPTYSGIFSFYPEGAIFYLLMAISAHLTLAYFFVVGHDALAKSIEDVVLYSQLGFSGMFVIYVLANFIDMLQQRVNMYKVLYQPRRMPYFTYNFASLVVVVALFFIFNQKAYYRVISGYYAGIGDLYQQLDDAASAKEYYRLSNVYSPGNHRANYALAMMAEKEHNYSDEVKFFKQSLTTNPSPFAYANLGAKYLDEKKYFPAIFILQDGLKAFPGNGRLLNNLGLAYLQTDNIDSAFYYLNRAHRSSGAQHQAAANVYAMLSKEGLSIKQDTLMSLVSQTAYLPAINNLVVLANELHLGVDDLGTPGFDQKEKMNLARVVYNYNKLLNNPALADTLFEQQTRIFYDSGNTSWFEDNLHFATALALYRQGKVGRAFNMLNMLAAQNPEDEYYPILGRLAMAEKANSLAIDYFKNAFQQGRLEVASELAFAYLQRGELDKASFIWKQIALNTDSNQAALAKKMMRVLQVKNLEDVLQEDVQFKYLFIAYRYHEFDLSKLEGLALTIENEDARVMGFLALFNAYLELGQTQKAFDILQQAGNIQVSNPEFVNDIYIAQCHFAYKTGNAQMMQELGGSLTATDWRIQNYSKLFQLMEKNSTQGADGLKEGFAQVGMDDPLFEPGVLEAAKFFEQDMHDADQAYQILLNGVKINPFSMALNKAYALQCIRVGLFDYAQDTREELRKMMPSVLFRTFDKEYAELLARSESEVSIWE